MQPIKLALILAAVGIASAASGQVAFSIDDNPAAPLTWPIGWFPGFGAEDPWGLGTYGGAWAPSPSLPMIPGPLGPAVDADVLVPIPGAGGPNVPSMDLLTGMVRYIDGISDNAALNLPIAPAVHLGFSVDRISAGQAGSAVATEAGFQQQPGDIYRTDLALPHPSVYVGTPGAGGYSGPLASVGTGNSNVLMFDDSQLLLGCGAGGNQVPSGVPAPPIAPGTHDNLDAFDWQRFDLNGDFLTDRWFYYTANPDAAMLAMVPVSSADIFDVQPLQMPVAAPYATAAQIGLDPRGRATDCIDALVVWDYGLPGGPAWMGPGAEPGLDFALFSLAHGSVSLAQWGLSEADVFFTDFNGSFWLYASSADLGLVGPPQPGKDNVDALDVLVPADANLDGLVDLLDLTILANNWTQSPRAWTQANFNTDLVVDLLDLTILANNWALAAGSATPEPGTLVLLGAAGLALLRRKRKAIW